ncbi:unnamed protein product [Somion occarium]|uniref:DUF6534 domain-containing protein n=1 Tax=Somion occarium TaxID=3059160 RepID=A0ABP1DVU5_9APHY
MAPDDRDSSEPLGFREKEMSASPPPGPPPMPAGPPIPELAGGYIVSFGIAFLVYGVTVAQAYTYLHSCDRDPRWMKWLAGIVFFLETIQSGFLFRELYFYTVLTIGNPQNLIRIDWSVPVVLISDSFIGFAVEIFYIHRVWAFSKNLVLTIGTVLLLLGWKAGLLYVCAGTIRFPLWTAFGEGSVTKRVIIFTLACVVAMDGTIATSMVYYLSRNRSSIKRTRDIVVWLIAYTVNTGVILVTMSTCALITYLAQPTSLLFHGFIIIVFKLYASSLFGALNTKHMLRSKMNQAVVIGTNEYSGSTALSTFRARPVHIEITQEMSKDTNATNDSLHSKHGQQSSMPALDDSKVGV